MDRRQLGVLFAVLGIVVVVTSALGLGGEGPGLGWVQVLGILVGVVLVVAGVLFRRKGPERPSRVR